MKKNNNKGFTLAELLVVVAILAILVAVAIPVFGNALDNARKTADDANIRSAYAQYTITAMGSSTFNGQVGQATQDQADKAFDDINVAKLQYYTKVDIPKDGGAWKGSGGKGGVAVAPAIFTRLT